MANFSKMAITASVAGDFSVMAASGISSTLSTSRYTTEITVNAQNKPSAPTGQVLWAPIVMASNTSLLNIDPLHPQVSIGLRGNYLDVFGVEVRAQDNTSVLYRNQYISTASLAFQFDNTALFDRYLGFYVYAFNMLNEYSDGTFVWGQFLVPPAPILSLTSVQGGSVTIEMDTLPANHPVQNVTLQVNNLTFVAPVSGSGTLYPEPGTQTYYDTPYVPQFQTPGQSFTYANYITGTPILPGSVTINWTGGIWYDNGTGQLVGTQSGQTGNIDYQLGYFSVFQPSNIHYIGGPLVAYFEWYGSTTPPTDSTPTVSGQTITQFQSYSLSGQPTSYSVTLPETGVFQIQAMRNDYIGNSGWSGPITIDYTAPSASGADLLANGDFSAWGALASAKGNQSIGVPTSWQIFGSTSNLNYISQYYNSVADFYACILNALSQPTSYIGIANQQAVPVAPGQQYTLTFNAWSNPALARGLAVDIVFRDQTGAFYAYASVLADATATAHYVQPFTTATGTTFTLLFTVPQSNASYLEASGGGVVNPPMLRPLDFVPSQMFVEFYNYNPNINGPPFNNAQVLISQAVLLLV